MFLVAVHHGNARRFIADLGLTDPVDKNLRSRRVRALLVGRSPMLAAGHTCACATSAGECGPAWSAVSESTQFTSG
jgi:hypothetical protein